MHNDPPLKGCRDMQVLMTDPVIAADGYTYEKAALQNWMLYSNDSPATGQPLSDKSYVPNSVIRSIITVDSVSPH